MLERIYDLSCFPFFLPASSSSCNKDHFVWEPLLFDESSSLGVGLGFKEHIKVSSKKTKHNTQCMPPPVSSDWQDLSLVKPSSRPGRGVQAAMCTAIRAVCSEVSLISQANVWFPGESFCEVIACLRVKM